jgi:F420-non-reducing hydrogenase iron-sulfur subunit
MSQTYLPSILALVCTYCTYTAADMAGSMRLQYPSNVRVLKLLCTGKVDVIHLLEAFKPERLEMFHIGASDAPKWAEAVAMMTRRALELGPNPLGQGQAAAVGSAARELST